jgi:ferric-dicitrate binding protein FerR (iron transport regulator)
MEKDYLIKKWLNNDLTDAEKEAFKHLDDYDLNIDILETAKLFKASQFSTIDDFEAFKVKYHNSKKPVKQLNWWNPLIKIASVLAISLGIYFTFFNNPEIVLKTIASEKISIELPDHSKVELNAESSIAYNAKTWKNNRALKLQGEAYFRVAKGNKFDVKTKQGIVTVVGTQFNVKQRDNYFEVKCFEGIVKVTAKGISKQLLAGETFQIIKDQYSEGKTKASSPKWIDNMSEFEAIPVKEVLAELERQYNIEVTVKDVNVDRLFTGGFVHNNLENALKAITHPMNMTYTLTSSNLVIIHETNN